MSKFRAFISILSLFFAGSIAVNAQKYHTDIQLSWWTDTTSHPELKPLVNLYSDYINSHPDSVYDNPHWNSHEKLDYKDFDFSQNSLFQAGLSAKALFSSFTPMLLKIEKKDTIYQLTSLLKAKPELGAEYSLYNPLAIMVYAAVKENGQWKMANILPYKTANWNKAQLGYITFYRPSHKVDNQLAMQQSIKFCDSICQYYDLDEPSPFSIYTVNGTHELGQLIGYDYYIYGNAEGKSINNIVISGNGNPYYPHEFIHQIWPQNDKRNRLLNEGIATWLGGSMNQDFKDLAKSFSVNALEKVDASFEKSLEDHSLNFYTQGAILCDLIHHYCGIKKLKLLLEKDTSDNDKLMQALLEITKWKLSTFNQNWECYVENISKS